MWTRKKKYPHLDKKIKTLSKEQLIQEIDGENVEPDFTPEELIYLIEHRAVDAGVRHAAYYALLFAGKLEDLQRLAKRVDFTRLDARGHSLLYMAAICDRIDVMHWLITIEPFTKLSDEERTKIILNVVSNCQIEVMHALAKPVVKGGFGWNLNVRGPFAITPVRVAMMKGHTGLAQLMISTVEDGGFGLPIGKLELRDMLNEVATDFRFDHDVGLAYHRNKPGRKHSTFSLSTTKNDESCLETYVPDSLLGQGRFGTVRLFVSEEDASRKLAVKQMCKDRMLSQLSGWHIFVSGENVENELCLLKRAYPNDGPYKIKHYVVQDGKQYDCRIVMPFVAGKNFVDARLDAQSPTEMAQLLLAIAEELQRIHELGIVHGDVRYTNILIDAKKENSAQPSFDVHFIDFGAANNKGEKAPNYGVKVNEFAPELWKPLLKPVYMQPSQDIYAFCYTAKVITNMTAFANELYMQYPSILKFFDEGVRENPEERPELKDFIRDLKHELLSCQENDVTPAYEVPSLKM